MSPGSPASIANCSPRRETDLPRASQLSDREILMSIRSLIGMTLLVLAACNRPAHAHFLFIRIGEPAEAGRTVEVFFSERAEAGDPRFIDKVAKTTLTLQSAPGKFEPLTVRK